MSRQRAFTPRTWIVDAVELVLAGRRAFAAYRRGRVDPAMRERVMVAVSRADACAGCTRVHEAWAIRAGVSGEDLERIGAGELAPSQFSSARRSCTRPHWPKRASGRFHRMSEL